MRLYLAAMGELGVVEGWPPSPIRTRRLLLRQSEARDRSAVIDLFSSPEVRAHLGGARARQELEQEVPQIPGRRPGFFVVELNGAMIGMVTIDRRDAERPGHLDSATDEAELSYMFLSHAWGHGYAEEASAVALDWFARTFPSEPIVLCTQTANARSRRLATQLGFTEAARFREFGAEQWFGVRSPQ